MTRPVALISLLLAAMGCVGAQTPAATPHVVGGKPNFTGIYEWPKSTGEQCDCSATIFDRKSIGPLKPGGEAFFEKPTGDPRHDEPRDFCMPAGFPSGMLAAYAVQIFQSKDYFVLVHEFQRMSRIVPLDGRKHREDFGPSFYGDPIGHFEGEALVIETTNFKRWSLDDHFYNNPNETRMHSDALRTLEHYRWKDKNTISYTLTIDDPKIFTAPWSQEFTMKARPDWEANGIMEYECQENNRCPGGHCQGK
jgi:hypothetical protein